MPITIVCHTVMKNSIDKAIYATVKNKQADSEEVLHYIRVVKGGAEYDSDDNDGED